MTIKHFGNTAILLELDNKISKGVSNTINVLYQRLKKESWLGVTNLIPAYTSLTIVFDPEVVESWTIVSRIKDLSYSKEDKPDISPRHINLPVCYDPYFGWDLIQTATSLGCNENDLIEQHCSVDYDVYMIGFLPGFPYLGLLPDQLECSRLDEPRKKVSQGSVAIAGRQTGIYPLDSPGGWRIIGNTPVPLFEPLSTNPFLIHRGDMVRFYAVTIDEHGDITERLTNGSLCKEDFIKSDD